MDGISQMDDPVQPGESFTYEYTLQDVGMYWYHPHMDTATTVEAGLAGGIRVREIGEQPPDIDLPVVLDDVLLDEDDQIEVVGTPHEQLMGRLGNHLLFNGREGRTVGVTQNQTLLLRLVNASNARCWDLTLVAVAGDARTRFEVQNDSEMHHPFHIHGNRFRMLQLNGQPWQGTDGWKDTWDIPPRSTITVESDLDNPGMWITTATSWNTPTVG